MTNKDAARIRTAQECLDKGEPGRAVKVLRKLTPAAWRQTRLDNLIWRAALALE
jgi:hypothetical protein